MSVRPRGRPPKESYTNGQATPNTHGRSTPNNPQRYSTPTARQTALLPTRSSRTQPFPAPTPAVPQQRVYYHPSYPPGPTPYFLPPPNQPTFDASLARPPQTQAFHSTYPSRLRTGVTNLIQPETVTGGPRDRDHLLAELDRELTTAGSGASTPRFDSPKLGNGNRRRGQVSYAEKGSDEEEEEEDEEEEEEVEEEGSDPEDGDFGVRGGKRRKTRGGVQPGIGSVEVQAMMRAGKLRKKKDDLDKGMTWLGEKPPGERVRSVRVKGTKHQYISEELLDREKDRAEWLVPITVDFDVSATNDHPAIKIKDRFLWNLNEPFLKPYQFASVFCDDISIPLDPYATVLSDLIQNQLDEAAGQGVLEVDILDKEVEETDVVWEEEQGDEVLENEDGLEDDEEASQRKAWKEADCRVVLNLDVQISTHILRDRIEWDLSSPLPPSIFAATYCRELGLTGEALPLITHALTDEIIRHKRDALDLELFQHTHPDEQAKWERVGGSRVNNRKGAKGLVGIWRDWGEREEFGPVLLELTVEEMERREQERTREARRMMRTLNTKRRR